MDNLTENYDVNPFMQLDPDGEPPKKKSKAIIIGIVVIAVVIVLAAAVFAVILIKKDKKESSGEKNSSPASVVKTYVESLYNKDGFEKYTKLSMPDSVYKVYKKEDDFQDDKDFFDDMIEDLKDNNIKIEITSTKKVKKLSDEEIDYAKQYFEEIAEDYDVDANIKIEEGYEYRVKGKINEDGDKETSNSKLCVVKIKGDGWKVINLSAEHLEYYYGDES